MKAILQISNRNLYKNYELVRRGFFTLIWRISNPSCIMNVKGILIVASVSTVLVLTTAVITWAIVTFPESGRYLCLQILQYVTWM